MAVSGRTPEPLAAAVGRIAAAGSEGLACIADATDPDACERMIAEVVERFGRLDIIVNAVGGGAGKVWVNSRSKTFHCQGDRFYGKTKEGAYMTEAEAKAKGAHADHGKACT